MAHIADDPPDDDTPPSLDIDALERELHLSAAREAVAEARSDQERATAMVALAAAAAFAEVLGEARIAAHGALGNARKVGDDELLLRVRAGRLSVYQTLNDDDAVLDELAQLAALCEGLERWDLLTVWLGALSDASGAAGEPEEALRYLERARLAADRTGDAVLVAKVAIACAEWTETAGRLSEARVLTEAAVDRCEEAGVAAAEEQAHQQCRLGMLSFRLEDFAAAHEQLVRAQEDLTIVGLTAAAAQLERNIGAAALHLGRVDEARERLVAALDRARTDLDRLEEGRIALDLGELARLTSDYPRARRWYSLARTIAGELDDDGMAASACSGLASAASAEGRWREALVQSAAALSRSRARGEPLGCVNSLVQLGQLHRVLGDTDLSKKRLHEAVRLATACGYALGEANASHGLGFLYHQLGRLSDAHAQFRRAMTFAFELGDRVGAANTFLGLNLVAVSAGRYGEAATEAETGLAVAREVGYRRMEQHLLRQLAVVALGTSDLATARTRVEEALAIGTEIDDTTGIADAESLLGEILARLGETEEGERRLRTALDTHHAVDDRMGAAVGLRRLGTVCLSRGARDEGRRLLRTAAKEFDAMDTPEELARALGALAADLASEGDPEAPALASQCLALLDQVARSLPSAWDRTPFDDRHRELRRRVDPVGRVPAAATAG